MRASRLARAAYLTFRCPNSRERLADSVWALSLGSTRPSLSLLVLLPISTSVLDACGVSRGTDDHFLLVDGFGVDRINGIAVGGFSAGALITVPVATKFDDRFQSFRQLTGES